MLLTELLVETWLCYLTYLLHNYHKNKHGRGEGKKGLRMNPMYFSFIQEKNWKNLPIKRIQILAVKLFCSKVIPFLFNVI